MPTEKTPVAAPSALATSSTTLDPAASFFRGSRTLLLRHAGGMGIGLVGSIILPMALGITEWGHLATAIFLSMAMEGVLAQNGISAFLIRSPGLVARNQAVAHTLQVLLGLVMMAALAGAGLATAWWIAQSSSLVWLFPCAGGAGLLASLAAVPTALLAKRMDFGRIAIIELAGVLALYGVSIPLAMVGLGTGLVGLGLVARGAVMAATAWAWMRPEEYWSLDRRTAGRILRESIPVATTSFGACFTETIMPLLAGLLVGTTAVGFYRIAYTIVNYPRVLVYVMGRVLFSLLGGASPPRRPNRLAWRTFLGSSLLLMPITLTVGAMAPLYVPRIFRDSQWAGLDLVFLLAAVHYTFYLLAYIPGQTLIAIGRSRDYTRFYVLYSAVMLAGTLAMSRWLGAATMPVAGIAASVALISLVRRFRQACPFGASRGALRNQLLLLVPAALLVWWLGRRGWEVTALGAWIAAVLTWIAASRIGRYNVSALLAGLLRSRAISFVKSTRGVSS
jgi:PST family polysaccharide transporter